MTDFWSRSWSSSRSHTLWSRSWPWSHYVLVSLTNLETDKNMKYRTVKDWWCIVGQFTFCDFVCSTAQYFFGKFHLIYYADKCRPYCWSISTRICETFHKMLKVLSHFAEYMKPYSNTKWRHLRDVHSCECPTRCVHNQRCVFLIHCIERHPTILEM